VEIVSMRIVRPRKGVRGLARRKGAYKVGIGKVSY